MASPSLQERYNGLTEPGWLLFYAIRSYILVLLETIIKRNRHLSEIRDEAFARFWNFINPPPKPNQPLVGSATLIPPLLATASGNVLEVGPGSGAQVRYFTAATDARKIYGAEPCVPLHPQLLANARQQGLSDRYEIVTAGAEKETLIPGLAKAGLLAQGAAEGGVFDTIVCVRVLCSVTSVTETGGTLFNLLKPGGKLLVCEHEVNRWPSSRGSVLARALQILYSLMGWTFFVGNCHLQRDIGKALVDAADPFGGWEEVDLKHSFGWSVLPYVSGTLVKRRK